MALEAGIRNQRIDSMAEVDGALPSTGVFAPFGDVVKKFTWNPDASIEARRGIGGVDPVGHDSGLETHSATVAYLLQGALEAGTPLYEAFVRNSDNELTARTIVQREKHFTGGVASAGVRTFIVLNGAKPATAKVPGDPAQSGPMQIELGYTVEKGRSYQISQPATAAAIVVKSSSELDTTQTLTVEDDEGTQEAIAMGGTGLTEFETIDAMELDAECIGDVYILDGTADGATLATIHGSDAYQGAEGDLGVPVIPTSGSRTATLGSAYQYFLGDEITHDAGDLAYEINSVELSIDNSVEVKPRHNRLAQRVVEGNRTIQLSATVMGETEYQTQVTRHLQATEADIVWTLTDVTLTLTDAVLIDVGEKTEEEGAAYLAFDNVFEAKTLTIA